MRCDARTTIGGLAYLLAIVTPGWRTVLHGHGGHGGILDHWTVVRATPSSSSTRHLPGDRESARQSRQSSAARFRRHLSDS